MTYLQFLFNSHLPFVKFPCYGNFFEETWFFAAMLESYLPMVNVLESLKKEGVSHQCSWIISPILTTMADDELLRTRFHKYIIKRLNFVNKEKIRYQNQPEFLNIIKYYEYKCKSGLATLEKFEGSLLLALKSLSDEGSIELIPSAATSVFFPLYRIYPQIVRSQISCGLANFRDKFKNLSPKSFWLPHCGYYPELEKYLQEEAIEYTFLTSSSLAGQSKITDPRHYKIFKNKDGFVFFPISRSLTEKIFNPQSGYPTHHLYRDFYLHTDCDLIEGQVSEKKPLKYGSYISEGFRYSSRIGKAENKELYQPQQARQCVKQHANDFVSYLLNISNNVKSQSSIAPVITCVVDLEFFGDWWFEGIDFWEQVFRILDKNNEQICCTYPSASLKKVKERITLVPSFASLDEEGYAEIWLNNKNDWLVKHLHLMVESMTELAQRFDDETGVRKRMLDQAAREVFLGISSDWPVFLYKSSNESFVVQELKNYLSNFYKIANILSSDIVFSDWFVKLEKKDNIFLGKDFSYKIFTWIGLPLNR